MVFPHPSYEEASPGHVIPLHQSQRLGPSADPGEHSAGAWSTHPSLGPSPSPPLVWSTVAGLAGSPNWEVREPALCAIVGPPISSSTEPALFPYDLVPLVNSSELGGGEEHCPQVPYPLLPDQPALHATTDRELEDGEHMV